MRAHQTRRRMHAQTRAATSDQLLSTIAAVGLVRQDGGVRIDQRRRCPRGVRRAPSRFDYPATRRGRRRVRLSCEHEAATLCSTLRRRWIEHRVHREFMLRVRVSRLPISKGPPPRCGGRRRRIRGRRWPQSSDWFIAHGYRLAGDRGQDDKRRKTKSDQEDGATRVCPF